MSTLAFTFTKSNKEIITNDWIREWYVIIVISQEIHVGSVGSC